MPKQRADEHGMKGTRAKKDAKAKRTFELHGAYTQKHLRLREEQAVARLSTRARVDDTSGQATDKTQRKKQ